jgi:hypothetical protein
MPEDRNPDGATLSAVREILLPRWEAIHRADVTWRRSRTMPDIASTAMCRHSVAFLRRLMIEADRLNGVAPRSTGSLSSTWRVSRGDLDADRLPSVPGYVLRDPTHFVMMDARERTIDLTADQFGMDPLTVHDRSDFFSEAPTDADPGLAATARAWAEEPSCRFVVKSLRGL